MLKCGLPKLMWKRGYDYYINALDGTSARKNKEGSKNMQEEGQRDKTIKNVFILKEKQIFTSLITPRWPGSAYTPSTITQSQTTLFTSAIVRALLP